MTLKRARNFVILLWVILPTTTFAGENHSTHAQYLANAGVMVAKGDTKVLFDPFFRNDYGQYDLVPAEMEAAIFAGTPPYDSIDALFISHHHDDHFDPALVMRYLQEWPEIQLYAPQQAVSALIAESESPSDDLLQRIHSVELEPDSAAVRFSFTGLEIQAVRVAHAGWPNQHAEVVNIVFRVALDESTTVMHLGDADAGRQHYAPHTAFWEERDTDLALVPVWLLLTDKGRYVLDEHVDAGHEIGIHVYKSVPDDPEDRSSNFEGLDIFTRPGETRLIE